MVIKATTKIGTGTQYVLEPNSEFLVGQGILVQSVNSFAIFGQSVGQKLTVAGAVISEIYLSGPGAEMLVQTGGSAFSDSTSIVFNGGSPTLVNAGVIRGDVAIFLDTGVFGLAHIRNTGTILANVAAIQSDAAGVVLRNSGTILAESGIAMNSSAGADTVINRGQIFGSIFLGDGPDMYDGRKGTVLGNILGYDGPDSFIPGGGREVILGGDGVDTLDFSAGRGITVNLDNAALNTGLAKGDRYLEIEQILGSLKGGDRLTGDGAGNVFFGFGGADVLVGRDGNDVFFGGGGKDLINAGGDTGVNSDRIIFNGPGEGGDRIGGFTFTDEVEVNRAAFGGGLAAGALDAGRFHAGVTNRAADAGDRFIFRTGDATLWFDRDGSHAGFAPVLLADFTDGTAFQFFNITVI
jgi:Ca2+-binding RTX toxin-like protein